MVGSSVAIDGDVPGIGGSVGDLDVDISRGTTRRRSIGAPLVAGVFSSGCLEFPDIG
jgi:hypothetical protein